MCDLCVIIVGIALIQRQFKIQRKRCKRIVDMWSWIFLVEVNLSFNCLITLTLLLYKYELSLPHLWWNCMNKMLPILEAFLPLLLPTKFHMLYTCLLLCPCWMLVPFSFHKDICFYLTMETSAVMICGNNFSRTYKSPPHRWYSHFRMKNFCHILRWYYLEIYIIKCTYYYRKLHR